MVERTRHVIDVRAEIPEILERDLAVQLREKDLAIATIVVFGKGADVRVVVLEPGPRLRLTVDDPDEPVATIGIAEAPRIVRVIRRRFPAVLKIVQPIALRLPEPEQPSRARECRTRGVVAQVAADGALGIGALEVMHGRTLYTIDVGGIAA